MPGVSQPTSRWEDPAEDAIYRAELAAGSRILRLQDRSVETYRFDPAPYRLAELITELLVEKGFLTAAAAERLDDLTQLHRFLPRTAMTLDTSEVNDVSRSFFDTSPAFEDAYRRWIRDAVVRGVVHADCLFQRAPTIRFHFPHQDGCFWHPRIHNDLMLGHPPQEINVWLPLARTRETSGMRIAPLEPSLALLEAFDHDYARMARSGQDDPDFRRRFQDVSAPVELNYGEFILFEPRCLHAPQYNVTELTRVSLDFRIIPVEDYEAMQLPYRGTGRRRMPFARGAYYDELSALGVGDRARAAPARLNEAQR
ncbi:MAG: hypothetical protein HY060_03590 [Proteobacteria bacterium]|nr:hypothetical protein [Pseudomonadota bacterium]